MPTLTYSEVSCGVNEFVDFYDDFSAGADENGSRTPEGSFQELVVELREKFNQSRRTAFGGERKLPGKYPCSIIVFSDVKDGPGTAFGEWLCKEFPDSPPMRQDAINPNSKNAIVAWVWALPMKALKAHPLWKALRLSTYKGRDNDPDRDEEGYW